MICDKIENLAHYEGICPAFADIVEFLEKNNAAVLEPGSHKVSDRVHVNVDEYTPGENEVFEFHREYTDLQYIVVGDEKLGFMHLGGGELVREYNAEIDAGFLRATEDDSVGTLFLNAGSFAVFEPHDPHCPGGMYRAQKVKKLIFKIKVD